MPLQLNYAAPASPKRWTLGYLPFVLPATVLLFLRFFYGDVAHAIADYRHHANIIAYSQLRRLCEDCLIEIMFNFTGIMAILLLLMTMIAFVPRLRWWMNARVPGWVYLLFPSWLVVLGVGLTTILR